MMSFSLKLTALLALVLLGACARLLPGRGTSAHAPCIAMREGVNATFRKPRGTGLVVGIEVVLDEPEAHAAPVSERGPRLAKVGADRALSLE